MPLPSKVSDAFRKLNPQIFALADPRGEPKTIEEARKRLRQKSGDGMNPWEREYRAVLDVCQWSHIYREVSLPLANGLRYKVDFIVVNSRDPIHIEAHEVKGRPLPTGIAKLKMAARLYPWIKFVLATKKKKRDGGGWQVEVVLP